jgi:hypothetical protein
VELVTTGGIQSYFDNVRLDAEPASSDPTPPTLASTDIVDNQGGGPVTEDDVVIYTVTFSEDMDETTVDAADFGNAPAATATISVGTPTETAPGVFTIPVTPTSAGTLQLQVNASAVLTDVAGNPLNTTSAIADNDTLTVDADNVAPSLLSTDITDDQGGATIAAGTPVTYTLTFYESAISPNVEDMDASTVTAGDFGNAGTATITIGAITETSPGVFTIEVTPDTGGTLRFQVNASADLRDVAGNALDTSSAIIDDTTINVDGTNPTLAGADIVDNQGGASVIINTMVTYTVTFSEDMNAATVDFSDFSNLPRGVHRADHTDRYRKPPAPSQFWSHPDRCVGQSARHDICHPRQRHHHGHGRCHQPGGRPPRAR